MRPAASLVGAVLAASIVFLLWPGIDLWFSGLFWRPGDGFFLQDWPLFRFLYRVIPLLTWAVVGGVVLAALAWLVRGQPVLGLERKRLAFIVLALGLGPGLLVNTVLKDHWGRARPSQVTEFGG